MTLTFNFKKPLTYLSILSFCTQPLFGVTLTNTTNQTIGCVVDVGDNQVGGKKLEKNNSWSWSAAQPTTCSNYNCKLYCARATKNWETSLKITNDNMQTSYNLTIVPEVNNPEGTLELAPVANKAIQ